MIQERTVRKIQYQGFVIAETEIHDDELEEEVRCIQYHVLDPRSRSIVQKAHVLVRYDTLEEAKAWVDGKTH